MSARGKHRLTRTSSPLLRGIVATGTGGAALALPLMGATVASAAEPTGAVTSAASVASAASTQHATAKAGEKAQVKHHSYRVVKGDSLAKIARDHSTRGGWKQLYADNREAVGENPSLIHPGLRLTLGAKSADASKGTASNQNPTSAHKSSGENSTGRAGSGVTKTESATATTSAPSIEAAPVAATTYTNDLDGWIRQSLDIMAANGIPGSYDGIYRNVMRESSGNPLAINNWDSNAVAGTPSKGLLQVIDPTFAAYHVAGTSMDPYDPVANITAACNYAADKYGSIDNVNGAY
ncbi:transglycosylase SLT domain-containing protein [Streptomyces sp. NPDC008313]|uniref:LysM peptidoglycan-binding domain-containing protein n=1 Tax=Streptomyces sp. NPDC008313 TaxID=3364826 RepID=UPI0036E31DA8